LEVLANKIGSTGVGRDVTDVERDVILGALPGIHGIARLFLMPMLPMILVSPQNTAVPAKFC